MPVNNRPSEISVLLLFNLDPNWPEREQDEVCNITSQLGQAISASGYRVTPVPVAKKNIGDALSKFNPLEHVVFNWCESLPGMPHSEWMVAEYLEKHGFTYTGADSTAIALSQNKPCIKKLLRDSAIPTPNWQQFGNDSEVKWDIFPAIVKLSQEHCSEGIDRNSVVTSQDDLRRRVRYIIEKYQQPALVEDFIDGRELHVTIWGNGSIAMLPPAEMEFSFFTDEHDRLCTYESKFVPESEQYQKIQTILPAPLNDEERRCVESLCKSTYRVSGCRDYARIDMRFRDGIMYVIDVNPNSDISPDTSTILAAELEGYSYGEFGARIIRLAAKRHPVWGANGLH